MDFDSAADELHTAPRSEFVALRDRRARQAQEEGDRDTARRIAALRKPTVAAWLVNLLARERPELLQQFLALGDSLREGSQLQEFAGRRRDLQQQLLREVEALAREQGQQVSSGTAQEITGTLNRALADAEAAATVRSGRLSSALEPSDALGEQWLTSVASQSSPSTPQSASQSTPQKPRRSTKSGRASTKSRAKSDDEQARAERQRREEQRAVEQAQVRLDRAEREAEQAHQEVEDLRRELDRAEQRRKKADKEVLQARSERDSAASRTRRG